MFLSSPARRRNLVLNRTKLVADYNRRRLGLEKALPVTYQTPLTSFADEPGREDEPVYAGEQLLFSFYRPGLKAGIYSTAISHDIQVTSGGGDGANNKLTLKSSKTFHVVGSRFTLEDGDVAGFYPPQGHGDFNNILPHIILNDQHLPWLRDGTNDLETDTRNSVPWLALLVFTDEELTVDPTEGLLPTGVEQDSTGGATMQFSDIFAAQDASKIASQFSKNDPEKICSTSSAKFIFVPGAVFRSLFCQYNDDGTSKEMKNGDKPDTSRYKYLAHCRKINMEGMPEQLVPDSGQRLYSIVMSHRTAPVDFTETTSVSVHLVSLENVENVTNIPDGKRVAMCSLHSWTYNVLPASMPTLQDRLRTLGDTLNVLRPAQGVIDSIGQGSTMPADIAARVRSRAQSGYTLVRYRVSTGDETIAFTRSPFVPGNVNYPMLNLPAQSITSGTDLQILDQHLGIMDITYCSAWQLGKSLAIADRSFTAALVRLRTQVAKEAVRRARIELTKLHGPYHTLEDTIANLSNSLKLVSALPKKASMTVARSTRNTPSRRWYRPAKTVLDLSITNPDLYARLEHHCLATISTFSAATDGSMFAEYNTPQSTDWQQVFTFLLDLLYLYAVPPHYLLPDPTLLPEESMRFFAIDKNWTDALIDGALSIANHQVPQMDVVTRKSLRAEFQKYLDTVDPLLGYRPQVPTYGVLMRSEVVAQFPSLSIRAPNPNANDLRAPILRQTIIADGTLLVLFDRVPGSSEFQTLTFQMPPHEQRFSIGNDIDATDLLIQWKRIYTANAPTSSYPPLATSRYKVNPAEGDDVEKIAVYDWFSRTLNMHSYTDTAFNYLKQLMKAEDFVEDATTATLAAIQLNDPLYEMSIGIDPRRRRLLNLAEPYCPIAMAFGPQSRLLALGPTTVPAPITLVRQPRAPITTPLSPLSTETPQPTADWEQRYMYGLWSTTSIPKERPIGGRYPIPNDLPYAIDLVFSIVRLPTWKPQNLTKIQVVIPVSGDVSLLEQPYDGDGGYMASNMRWTYAEFEDQTGQMMLVGALPRDDTRNSSPVADNREITFVLRQCRIPKTNAEHYVTFREYFEGQEEAAGGALWYKLVPSSEM